MFTVSKAMRHNDYTSQEFEIKVYRRTDLKCYKNFKVCVNKKWNKS